MDKSVATAKIRYPNRWRKGTSGNPKGRPKVEPNFRRLAKEKSEQALLRLIEIASSSKYSPELQTAASMVILDLAWDSSKTRRLCLKKVQMGCSR
jgi:Family of unknown function (DUF5681)